MRRTTAALLCAALCGCARLSFRKLAGPEEHARVSEIERLYREEAPAAFAAGDAERLAALFDPAITRPMTHAKIADWGREFFGKHRDVRFHADDVVVERLGAGTARVLLRYRVTTRGGDGDFGGTEADELVRRGGRWLIASWEKLQAGPGEP